MAENYLPTREADYALWQKNFDALITATPTAYGLTTGQATEYDTLFIAWTSAYNIASTPSTRTPSAIQAKNDAKAALTEETRKLVKIIQGYPNTTNEMRVDLGITVPDVEPTPVPQPEFAPSLTIVSVMGRTVKIRLRDVENPDRRGKPTGVQGATVLSYVGEEPPADPGDWSWSFNTSKTVDEVTFPATVAAGSKVWITAVWFNARKQNSPAAAAQSTNISGGLAMAA